MNFKKSLVMLCAVTILGYAADSLNASNAAIVEAIKSNPGLLDAPQAKKYMETNTSSARVSQSTQATQVIQPNIIEDVEEKNIDAMDKGIAQDQNASVDLNVLTRSPLSIENNENYLKRLMDRQIKERPRQLKRYGIEFFSNKNGLDLASLPVPDSYKLVPKDVVSVILYGPKTDNMSLTVDKDGNIVIPSFGPLRIAGLAFSDAKKTISDALMAAFPNVGVTVNISQFSSIQVTLAGEVATPGIYNVSSFSTVKEALIAAGGLSKNGSMRSVMIKRNGRVFRTIDLYTIIRGSGGSDAMLQAGDVIVVPVMGKNVIIDGDVKRPAIYEAKNNTTIANLINYAGGLSANASKNDIQITRYESHQGIKVMNVSLADAGKIVAMDQDSVYVHDFDTSNLQGITIYGNIIKPGFWPLSSNGASIEEFFKREVSQKTLRGVFLEDTYFDYAIIKRTNANLKEELIGFSLFNALNGKEKIQLKNRDELYIMNRSSVLEKSIVKISGECLARPGEYQFFDKMTFESLVSSAGLTCLIDKTRVSIISRDTQTQQRIVKIVDATNKTIPLHEFDEVSIVGFYTLNPDQNVSINGEVYLPGNYPIGNGDFSLRDLIIAAGGMTDKASIDKIEIIRYEIVNGIRKREVMIVNPSVALSEKSPVLKAYDEVTVFKIPKWNERKSVKIVGKVKYPGEYAIEDGDRLSDILKRAGGFTDAAYVDAAVFTRKELQVRQQEGLVRQLKDLESRIMFSVTQPTELGQKSEDKSQMLRLLDTLKEEAKTTPVMGRLSIHLENDLRRFKGSYSDVLLKDGDALYIPEREDSVLVEGEVLNPNAIVYAASMSVNDYIEKSGGLKRSADEKNIFIVHANGEAEVPRSGYLFGSGVSVGPGDMIVVPMYMSTYSGMQLAKDITAILYQLAVSAAALKTVGGL